MSQICSNNPFQASTSQFKILSQNIQLPFITSDVKSNWNKSDRIQKLLKWIQSDSIDCILVQEAFRMSTIGFSFDSKTALLYNELKKLHFNVELAPTVANNSSLFCQNSGLLIASTYPILESNFISFKSVSDNLTIPTIRGFLVVKLKLPYGPILLINTHLEHQEDLESIRQSQLNEIHLFTMNQTIPIILAGDLNTQNPILPEEWTRLNDKHITTWPVDSTLAQGQMLDFFYSKNCNTLQLSKVSRWEHDDVSDHYGLVLHIDSSDSPHGQ
ncbi:Endonuclease/exonuclease/phosphatase [Globomyces pollinis-pini]|nr:Endonuclease/exonuclease/phosphatase [Globomyces pollinis-pini]